MRIRIRNTSFDCNAARLTDAVYSCFPTSEISNDDIKPHGPALPRHGVCLLRAWLVLSEYAFGVGGRYDRSAAHFLFAPRWVVPILGRYGKNKKDQNGLLSGRGRMHEKLGLLHRLLQVWFSDRLLRQSVTKHLAGTI